MLDDKDMHAVAPNKGDLKGFQESCACIFFIIPKFIDEKLLTFEVNCAQ